jgi:hypothetical protein
MAERWRANMCARREVEVGRSEYVREGIYCTILLLFFAVDVHVVVRRVMIRKRWM